MPSSSQTTAIAGPTTVAQLPTVELVGQLPAADQLVVGLQGSDEAPQWIGLPEGLAGDELLALARELGATPKAGHVTRLPRQDGHGLVVVGLGGATEASEEADEHGAEQLRRSTGSALRTLARQDNLPDKGLHVVVSLATTEPDQVRAVVEGALLGSYRFTPVGSTPRTRLGRLSVLAPVGLGTEARRAVDEALAVSAAVITARDWINTPANLLYPETFAEQARALAGGTKLDVEVLDEKALARQGFGGILAVGGGSQRPPRLVRVDHHPRGASNHLVLVGKGITFDTGGLNLKSPDGMYTMKDDMSGAAAVLAATRAIAELGLDVWVTAYAPMAENMPSGSAYRPSDVVTMYGGTTVENVNSDAEGRIVMADALARAKADRPSLVVDVATLTGACVVALGLRTAGLMTSDDQTADLLLDAAETAGEDFWQLPIPAHIRSGLDSQVADLKSGGPRQGGALTAAAFLQRFVEPGTAWAHLDIAGPAFNDDEAYDYVPTGATGYAVRTLVELARELQH